MREHNDFEVSCEVSNCKKKYYKDGLCQDHFKGIVSDHDQRIEMGQVYGKFSNNGKRWTYGYLLAEHKGDYIQAGKIHWSSAGKMWKYFIETIKERR